MKYFVVIIYSQNNNSRLKYIFLIFGSPNYGMPRKEMNLTSQRDPFNYLKSPT